MSTIVNLFSIAGTNGQTLSAGDSGWSLHPSYSATAVVINGRGRQSNSTTSMYVRSEIPGDANQTVSAALYYAGAGANALGVCARVDASANTMFLAQVVAPNEVKLFKFVAGTVTQIGGTISTTMPEVGAAKTIEMSVSGSSPSISVVVKWGGATVISQTVSESALDAAGKVGVRFGTASAATDTTGLHLESFNAVDTASGVVDATADGVTLTGTATLTPGTATEGSSAADATAEGVTLTGTSTITPGTATGGASGSFVSSPMYSSGILQASVALDWTWYPGAIGATPTAALVHGSGATAGDGTLTMPGLPAGSGFLLAETADGAIYYEAGTVI